jgi:hypothetical protein
MPRNSTDTSTKRQRIAELAKQDPQMVFTSLNHLLDLDKRFTEPRRRKLLASTARRGRITK